MKIKCFFVELALTVSTLALPGALGRLAVPQAPSPLETVREAPAIPLHEEEEALPDAAPSRQSLSRLFHGPEAPLREERREIQEAGPETGAPAAEEGRFRFLGSVRDEENGERLYLKDTESGGLVAVAVEAVIDADAETYLMRIGGTLCAVRRN